MRTMIPDTLLALIKSQAAQSPEPPVILAPGRRAFGWGALIEQITRAGKQLREWGIGPADRVALVLPNGPEMAWAFLSVASHAAAAPLNPAFRAVEFEFYLSDLKAGAVILPPASPNDPFAEARAAARKLMIPILEIRAAAHGAAGKFDLELETSEAPNARQLQERKISPGDLPDPAATALILHTSGTTARPKIVPLSQANLCASAQNIARSLDLTNNDRGLNVMPLFHIHGLMAGLLAPLAAGGSAVCSPGFDAERFFDWIEEFHPAYYTAVPTIHQAILEYAGHPDRRARIKETIARCPLRFIRSSSSALPPRVLAELEDLFHAPVLEAYGMTEATHQMAINPPPPAKRKPGTVGLASGTEIAIAGEKGDLLDAGQRGEIVIRGPGVTAGYENNPKANAAAFFNGWFRTGDEGWLDAEGYLTISGRMKEMINRGGEKVSPREVDEALLGHPAVAQAVAFGIPHPKLGEYVGAAVVLRKDAAATELELRRFAADRLADFKVPSQILIVEAIPKGPTGKLARIGLADKFAQILRRDFAPPATEMEKSVAEVWSEVLAVGEIGIRDNFFAIGGDSLSAARAVNRLSRRLGFDLPLRIFFENLTIESLAAAIVQWDEAEIERALAEIENLAEPPR